MRAGPFRRHSHFATHTRIISASLEIAWGKSCGLFQLIGTLHHLPLRLSSSVCFRKEADVQRQHVSCPRSDGICRPACQVIACCNMFICMPAHCCLLPQSRCELIQCAGVPAPASGWVVQLQTPSAGFGGGWRRPRRLRCLLVILRTPRCGSCTPSSWVCCSGLRPTRALNTLSSQQAVLDLQRRPSADSPPRERGRRAAAAAGQHLRQRPAARLTARPCRGSPRQRSRLKPRWRLRSVSGRCC